MSNFIFIFTNIIIPIFIPMLIGYIMQKCFSLNVGTLSKLQFYVLIPSLLFVKIYDAQLSKELFLSVMLNSVVLFILLFILSQLTAKLLKYPKPSAIAFVNSVCFYNSGNYCLPLIQLLYNNSFAFSIQIIIMTVQNIITNTFGIFNTSSGNRSPRRALLEVLRIPMLYGVLAALAIKAIGIGVWTPIRSSLDILGQGMVPVALFTLGVQLANTKFTFKIPRVYLANFMRLIISPALASLLVSISGIHGIIAQVIVISSAAPTAVNTVLLSIEYDNEPEFASQAVFISTLLSCLTVSGVIYLATRLL